MSGTAGKVALATRHHDARVQRRLDALSARRAGPHRRLVGYGNANFFEGPAAAPTLSNTTAALRLSGGCVDTDSNGADFNAGSPTPRASGTPDPCDGDAAPAVAARTPAAGAADVDLASNVAITFNEPVNVTGDWFSISCTQSDSHAAAVSGGPTTFTLNPDADFSVGRDLHGDGPRGQVTDQDADDPPDNMPVEHVFSFTTVRPSGCAAPATHQIAQVQGSGAARRPRPAGPRRGHRHRRLPGRRRLGGFFIQDDTPDADPATSDGLFVFSNRRRRGRRPRPRQRHGGESSA